jgi:hypothetical protein
MPDQSSGNTPSRESDSESLPESAIPPSAPEQYQMSNTAKQTSGSQLNETVKLERDIKKGEIALIVINALLLITTIVIARIYSGQLDEMRKATDAATKSANAADATLKEIRQGGTDTHELAVQAKNQADRTKDVADRALIQANATNDLAKQARIQANISGNALRFSQESADQDRRPWVGLATFQCNSCTSDAGGTLSIGDMFGVMQNTGKTPAVQMIVHALWLDLKRSDPIPDYDSVTGIKNPYNVPAWLKPEEAAKTAKRMDLMKKFNEATVVLPPNAVRNLPIIGGIKVGREKAHRYEDDKIFYVVGKITYFSTPKQGKMHTTRFCLMNDFATSFRFCPTGNDMD